MNNFDLNALGVKEMRKNELMEVNGGEVNPNPWWYFAKEIAKVVVYLGLEIVDDLSERASKDGYVTSADIGHR